jgi:hypothetical protein
MQYDMNRQPTRQRAGFNLSLPKPTSSHYLYAGIGAFAGLLLGLFFAWMVWPVQWTNAWPADLSQEARAQYLAAVAEAYVYYGDAQAAQVARNRLFNLNDDLEGYIVEAQRFFIDNPQASSRVYINNLGQLAQALEIQSPDIIIETPVDGTAADAASDTQSTESAVGDGVRAWVNWALTVLAALILVGGGFYVVGRLNQRRLATNEGDTLDDGGFDEEPGSGSFLRPMPGGASSPYMRPLRGSSSTAMPTSVQRGAQQHTSDEFGGFDDDDSDDPVYMRGTTSRALDYHTDDEIFDEPIARNRFQEEMLEDDLLGDEMLDDEMLDDEMLDDDLLDDRTASFDESETIFAPRTTVTAIEDLDTLDDELLEGEPISSEPAAIATPTVPSRGAAGVRTLNTYTFQYHAGIADYDQSRPIIDPETGLQVGDCGMGVNVKNNIVQNNPDNVVALDVWLVDKKQEKSFSSQDRVLLSEYVVDHNLESTFTRERPNDPSPIIPQPGTTFQIKGPTLTLDCVVTEVSYIKNGPAAGMFQSLSIDMTVRSRG